MHQLVASTQTKAERKALPGSLCTTMVVLKPYRAQLFLLGNGQVAKGSEMLVGVQHKLLPQGGTNGV